MRVRMLTGTTGALGLALIVVGTFLPWLHSGRDTHNSYQADGVAQRLLSVPGWLGSLLAAWPFVGLACAVVAAVFALGGRRLAAALGALLGVGTAAVAIGVLSLDHRSYAAPAVLGPVVTLLGGICVLLTATICGLGGPRTVRPGSRPRMSA